MVAVQVKTIQDAIKDKKERCVSLFKLVFCSLCSTCIHIGSTLRVQRFG